MRKFPPKLSRKLSIFIVASVTAVLFVGIFFALYYAPRNTEVAFYAEVLEVKSRYLRANLLKFETDYHGGLTTDGKPIHVDFDMMSNSPPEQAYLLDVVGNEISHGEIPLNSIVLVTYKGPATTLQRSSYWTVCAFSIQIVDSLPETA